MQKRSAYQIAHQYLKTLSPTDRTFARAQLILKLHVDPELLSDEDDATLEAAVETAVKDIAKEMSNLNIRSTASHRRSVTTESIAAFRREQKK